MMKLMPPQRAKLSLGFTFSGTIGIKNATEINPSFTFDTSLRRWGFYVFSPVKRCFPRPLRFVKMLLPGDAA
jgi:hypothetical protein